MPRPMPENLKVIHTSERGAECGRLARGVPKPGLSFHKQRFCNQRCIKKDKCMFLTMSLTLKPDKLGRYPCYIKSQRKEMQEFFENLFDKGETGLVNIITELYSLLWVKSKQAPTTKELIDVISIALDMKKGIYGDKQKIEHSGNIPIQIIIERPEKTNDGTNTDNSLEAN